MKNMKQARQQGFTLIELMIVIAIVGILSAVALPAYQDYTTRAKFSEVLAEAGSAKTSYTEYIAATGSKPSSASDAGISTNSTFIESVTVTDSSITFALQGMDSAVDAGSLIFTPTYSGLNITGWTCSVSGIADTAYGKLPSNCRST